MNPQHDLRAGQRVGGRYLVDRPIGRWQIGTAYAAREGRQETPRTLQTALAQARHDLLWAILWESDEWAASSSAARQAATAYEHALAYAEQHGELHMKRQALAGLGRLARRHHKEQAHELLWYAVEQDDLMRAGLSVQELKAGFLQQSSDVLETLFAWSVEDEDGGRHGFAVPCRRGLRVCGLSPSRAKGEVPARLARKQETDPSKSAIHAQNSTIVYYNACA